MHVVKIHNVKLNYNALAIAMGNGKLFNFLFTVVMLRYTKPAALVNPSPFNSSKGSLSHFRLRCFVISFFTFCHHHHHHRSSSRDSFPKQKIHTYNFLLLLLLLLLLLRFLHFLLPLPSPTPQTPAPLLTPLPPTDVTPKALMHRVAKLRSIAEDASTPTSGASSGLGLPQPAKRAPRASTGKKVVIATAADKTPTKRTATGAVKYGNNGGGGGGGSPLQNVVAAYSGDGGSADEEEKKPGKKVKTASAGKGVGTLAYRYGYESMEAGEGEGKGEAEGGADCA